MDNDEGALYGQDLWLYELPPEITSEEWGDSVCAETLAMILSSLPSNLYWGRKYEYFFQPEGPKSTGSRFSKWGREGVPLGFQGVPPTWENLMTF